MRRSPAISLVLLATALGCGTSTAPGVGTVRGLGFDAPISAQALSQLSNLGTVLSVSRAALVVMMQSEASSASLGAVSGTPHVGPDLGSPDSLEVEAAMEFPGAPTEEDIAKLAEVGTITFTFPEYHAVFLMVPVRDLGRLDDIPNVVSAYVTYDPVRTQ